MHIGDWSHWDLIPIGAVPCLAVPMCSVVALDNHIHFGIWKKNKQTK